MAPCPLENKGRSALVISIRLGNVAVSIEGESHAVKCHPQRIKTRVESIETEPRRALLLRQGRSRLTLGQRS